ncbi:ABC transporter permease [Dokdonella sp.]|uniref:ABC transporter permease n=1 Tax=Dokdonella sp. TaxID=2291710 RepID=UPI0031C79D03|nr:FtsX-like permease family protein [Dokdonella sp.]
MKPLAFAARSLRREFRHAELATLAAALVLAVAALAAVATLASRVEQAIVASAAELLGGDLAISASRPLPADFVNTAQADGLATSQQVEFNSMLFAGARSRLSEVRANDARFPLRGSLVVQGADGGTQLAHAPPRGRVYVDPEVLQALQIRLGDQLQLGDGEFAVAATIVQSPDSGDLLRFAPRAVMNIDDALASGLLGPGSRARHRLLVAGAPDAVTRFASWARAHLPDGAELTTVADAQQNLRQAFERGQAFLRMAALLAALLSGIAVALGAQRFARRKVEEVALLRCLGARRGEILAALLLELGLLALPACLLGLALGIGLQQAVFGLAGSLLPGPAPSLPWAPPLAAFAVGVAVLFGFALPPLLRLRDVEPVRVFRQEVTPRVRRFDALYLLPLAVGAGLILAGAGSLRLAGTLAAGFAGIALVTAALGILLLWLARAGSARLGGALRFGLANLARRRVLTLLQAGALALGLTALALLGVIGPSLLSHWRAELPADTPNWFALNIQPAQRSDFEHALAGLGAQNLNLLPMAVGKLVAINGQAPHARDSAGRRAAGRPDGEVRLSWSQALPEANTVLAGHWFGPAPGRPELSVDRSWRDRFDLKLGDTLTLRIGEHELSATVTSFRGVDWESFRANFFLMLDPASGASLPHSYIGSFHIAPGSAADLAALSREFPNLSLVDISQILDRVRDIIAQVSGAVTWVLGFSLLAGLLVLLAALAATADERRFEAALLRALGAARRQVSVAVLAEFAALGLIAGMIAIAGAAALGSVLASEVLRMHGYVPPFAPLVGIVLGAALVIAVAGWAGSLRIARSSPMGVLRRA